MAPSQLDLPVKIAVENVIDELDMGVLEDGTAYLNGRSLATVCGVAASAIIYQAGEWGQGKRDNKLAKMLLTAGLGGRTDLFIKIHPRGGNKLEHAYTDDVCTKVLEYYAFESNDPNSIAQKNFRLLAQGGLRALIYGALGYDPNRKVNDSWKKFHDRLLLNPVPPGYFSVFREMSELVVTGIQNGLVVDEHSVPDISIGQGWAKHWKDSNLEAQFGERIQHLHSYPDYFPQGKKTDIEASIYPLKALGDFRLWMQQEYIPKKFPNYLANKVSQKKLATTTRDLILQAVDPKKLKA